VSTSTIVLGGRSPVADPVLDHHRANFRPRVAAEPSPPRAVPRPSVAGPSVRRSVGHVLVLRVMACLMFWGVAGTIYGCWQLGNALVPLHQHGEVTCAIPRGVGSIPGC
jgi:hypothetical protein